MSLVDTSKARAYAEVMDGAGEIEAAGWIHGLADEVESLERALANERADKLAASLEATKLQAERDAAVAGLREVHTRIAEMLREARLIADNHPDPVAAGTAQRILGKEPAS